MSTAALLSEPGPPFAAAVADARACAGQALAVGAWTVGTDRIGEGVREVLALRAKCQALLGELVREAAGRGVPAEAGAKDTAGWLASVGRLGRGEARELAELAAALDPAGPAGPGRCPAAGAALGRGELDLAQARVITAWAGGLPAAVHAEPGLRAQAEALLVEQAATLDPRGLAVAARALHETLVQRVGALDRDDPEEAARLARDAQAAERDAYARRSVTRRRSRDGLARIEMLLTPEVADALFTALDPLAARRPDDDGVTDTRTLPQRRADAVEELLARALDAGTLPERGGERPHTSVLIRWETLLAGLPRAGLLDTGQPLGPGAVRRALCDAGILPIVLGGNSVPLDVGRERRLFDRYQRRALLARDGGCAGPGCDPHPARTQAHHGDPWHHGGGTGLANGGLFCPTWHTKIHTEGWTVRLARNGHPELIPPTWIDPQQRPRQNHRFRNPPAPPPPPHRRT